MKTLIENFAPDCDSIKIRCEHGKQQTAIAISRDIGGTVHVVVTKDDGSLTQYILGQEGVKFFMKKENSFGTKVKA